MENSAQTWLILWVLIAKNNSQLEMLDNIINISWRILMNTGFEEPHRHQRVLLVKLGYYQQMSSLYNLQTNRIVNSVGIDGNYYGKLSVLPALRRWNTQGTHHRMRWSTSHDWGPAGRSSSRRAGQTANVTVGGHNGVSSSAIVHHATRTANGTMIPDAWRLPNIWNRITLTHQNSPAVTWLRGTSTVSSWFTYEKMLIHVILNAQAWGYGTVSGTVKFTRLGQGEGALLLVGLQTHHGFLRPTGSTDRGSSGLERWSLALGCDLQW